MISSLLGLFTSALFLPYALIAWGVVLLRLATRRFQRIEWLMVALLLAHHAVEVVQLLAERGTFVCPSERYFGPAAPLLWCWTAYGLVQLWRWQRPRWCWLTRAVVVVFLAYLVGYPLICKTAHEYRKGSARDAFVAAQAIAPIIRADYQGPARSDDPSLHTPNEYYTTRRPRVGGAYTAAAWAVRGQGALSDFDLPVPYDYLFLRADDPKTPDAADYTLLHELRGTRHLWRLYRRNPTPSQQEPTR